ncbi:hypothetical protein SAMN04488700_1636 [Carnobacterium iners]|uniref:Uncharacterized protein n=1 Tax=Carnobacterium iners TaxID=1073423 RepID=A0A1X7NAL2_9LACT|nr:hypothetical protein SAMN04488114_1578 [Carnobacterium iners]SMH34114.1 hypothetical protein SAMN04488700_1636 [Carnobacterium iners]
MILSHFMYRGNYLNNQTTAYYNYLSKKITPLEVSTYFTMKLF